MLLASRYCMCYCILSLLFLRFSKEFESLAPYPPEVCPFSMIID